MARPEKASAGICSLRALAALFLKTRTKKKLTALPDYIDSSTVKSPGIGGHVVDVFLLSG